MIVYLVDTPIFKVAYIDAEKAVSVAVSEVEKWVAHKKKARREIFSDHDGLHTLRVSQFDKPAVTAYLEAMKVHRKVILSIYDPLNDETTEVSVHKILLETGESTCRKTFQEENSSHVLTESRS